jgi:hypothetical protein
MERVILVGTDPSITELYRVMAREGVEVEVRGKLDGGIVGNSASIIMVDELLAKVESDILYGALGNKGPCVGLIEGEGLPPAECPRGVLVYGSQRPYLKRKKGRS